MRRNSGVCGASLVPGRLGDSGTIPCFGDDAITTSGYRRARAQKAKLNRARLKTMVKHCGGRDLAHEDPAGNLAAGCGLVIRSVR